MLFQNVHQEVFDLEDITTLVESLRVERNKDIVLVFDLEAHAQRLLNSILKLNFKLTIEQKDFSLLLLNQVKNKLQYYFNQQVAFTDSELDEEMNLLRLSTEVYKLRITYTKEARLSIAFDEYKRNFGKAWKVKLLSKDEFYIDSTNPIWQHKFLPRPNFNFFLDQGYDEILWLDEEENLCEGSFSTIILDKNQTPLGNTLPSISLSQRPSIKAIKTKTLPKKLYLVNSLIGKVEAYSD